MNKKILAGCGCLVLLIIGMIAAGLFSARHILQKGKGWITAQIDDANHRSAIESAWQPPSAMPNASWFPVKVGTWTLSTNEDIAGVPELQLDRAGHRGKYRGDQQDME